MFGVMNTLGRDRGHAGPSPGAMISGCVICPDVRRALPSARAIRSRTRQDEGGSSGKGRSASVPATTRTRRGRPSPPSPSRPRAPRLMTLNELRGDAGTIPAAPSAPSSRSCRWERDEGDREEQRERARVQLVAALGEPEEQDAWSATIVPTVGTVIDAAGACERNSGS